MQMEDLIHQKAATEKHAFLSETKHSCVHSSKRHPKTLAWDGADHQKKKFCTQTTLIFATATTIEAEPRNEW